MDGDAGELGTHRGGDRLEAIELLEEVTLVVVGFVGGGEVGPDPGHAEVGIGVAGAGQGEDLVAGSKVPSRPIPLSCLMWTRAGRPLARARAASIARKSSLQTPTSEPAERTTSTSSMLSAPIVSSGTCWKRRPIAAASPAVATAKLHAPPASAASATASAPCP